MSQLELKLEEFNKRHQLVNPAQSVLLAVSGGLDSMVMLHLFSKLPERMKLHLSVVHINHQLRGEESMMDEEFVREMSDAYGIPSYCERIDVVSYAHEKRLSKQVAARQLRYECFERIRRQLQADVIATAHQADDNAETVLLNILRGTGVHGLAGIPLKRDAGCIIRPLLFATRTEIETYANKNGIKYRSDSSNRSLAYRRNYLRHNIVPALERQTPGVIDKLNTVALIMYDVNKRLRKIVDKVLGSCVEKGPQDFLALNVKRLAKEADFLRDEVFLELLNRMQIEPSEKKIEALRRLCTLPTGRIVELSGTLSAYRNRDLVVFRKTNLELVDARLVEFGRSYDYNGYHVYIGEPRPVPKAYSKTHAVEYVDAERLGNRLILRSWHEGDWFIPLGMRLKKKLSDFFTDQKIPLYQKSSIPVLESDGNIVWICGERIDDRFKLTERTRSAVQLIYKPPG